MKQVILFLTFVALPFFLVGQESRSILCQLDGPPTTWPTGTTGAFSINIATVVSPSWNGVFKASDTLYFVQPGGYVQRAVTNIFTVTSPGTATITGTAIVGGNTSFIPISGDYCALVSPGAPLPFLGDVDPVFAGYLSNYYSANNQGVYPNNIRAGIITLGMPLVCCGEGGDGFSPGPVTELGISPGAVTNGRIADGAVGATKIATDAVTAVKIMADAVGASEIADDAVGASEIVADGVGSAEVANGSLTSLDLTPLGTAGTYRHATVTTDVAGRVTSAVSGNTITTKASDQLLTDVAGTYANVTDLVSGTLTSGKTYHIRVFVSVVSSLGTNGMGIGWTFSGTGAVNGKSEYPATAAGASNTTASTALTFEPATGANCSISAGSAYIDAIVTPVTSGTFQVRAVSEVTSTITVKGGDGTKMIVTEL